MANNLARLKVEEILDNGSYNLSGTDFKDFADKSYKDYQYRIIVKRRNDKVKKVVVIVRDLEQVRAKLITLVTEEN